MQFINNLPSLRNPRGSRAAFNAKSSNLPPQEDAVKKFGGAKAISSDMYFGNQDVSLIQLLYNKRISLIYSRNWNPPSI